jgi:hypothetical protein
MAGPTTLGLSGRKGGHPGVRRPTSTSSIDTALPHDRSSSCCVRAVRAPVLLEPHGLGRLVIVEAHDVIVAVQRLTEEAVLVRRFAPR